MSEILKRQHCGKCGATLSGYARDGLCAACLLESAFEESSAGTGEQSKPAPLLSFSDYELLEEIDRGGMGVVYRARQISLNRIVAVKMILAGQLANAADVQRFKAEAETVAHMRHPNIIAIHEVGAHNGQPFFSMDYVQGRSLAELTHNEPLPARLAAHYLKTIAEAVQYAHSRGVLHRDLKPSNILIDEADQPRIADFGLAKRLDDSQLSTNDPHLTQAGQVLGSPSFIPPEQAAGGKKAIGPASDVYSLGAILYHLLTGHPPFMAETVTATLRMVAENEAVSPRLLNASVPRDLETICLKCLEKDPKRRYVTAQDLADELGRFLRGEPIQARPAKQVEKVWRWCRRKPAFATAVFLVLVVAIGSPIAAFRINRERLQAEANLTRAEVMAKFLTDTLESAGPSVAQGRDTKMLNEILDKAARRVGIELKNQPEAEADVRLIIGKTYQDLGQYTNALVMTREALRLRRAHFGPKHITVASALNNLGAIYYELSDFAAAEAHDREALAMKKELLGDENLDVAMSMSNLGFRLWNRSDYAAAEKMHREALRIRLKKLNKDHPDVGKSLNNLAMVLWSRGDFDDAEALFRDALAIFRNAPGGDQTLVATMLNNVGTVLRNLGRLDEAGTMTREALEMRQKLLGKRHPYAAYSENNLAIVLERQGKLAEAEALFREALALQQESLGTNHQFVAETLSSLAVVLGRKGDVAASEAMQRDALAMAERVLGKESPDAAESRDRLAVLVATRGDFADAEAMLTNALAMTKKLAGKEHPDVISPLWHLAWVLKQRGDLAAAESLHKEATMLSTKGGNYSIRALTDSSYDLADLLQVQGKFAEAEPLLLAAAAFLQDRPSANRSFQRAVRERLVRFYEAWDHAVPNPGKRSEAVTWRKQLEELNGLPNEKQ